ncbi:MAG: hypothetical protein AB1609_19795 [Bacillota bacterium]
MKVLAKAWHPESGPAMVDRILDALSTQQARFLIDEDPFVPTLMRWLDPSKLGRRWHVHELREHLARSDEWTLSGPRSNLPRNEIALGLALRRLARSLEHVHGIALTSGRDQHGRWVQFDQRDMTGVTG